jgi:hypothetical protein
MMLLDFIVLCAIIIGIVDGLSKIKSGPGSSYKSCNNLLEFLFINK